MEEFVSVLPVGIAAGIFGFVLVLERYWKAQHETVKLPAWFIFVPLGIGMIAGVIQYFVQTPSQELGLLTVPKKILGAFLLGFSYAGASVLLHEIKKGAMSMLKGSQDASSGTKP